MRLQDVKISKTGMLELDIMNLPKTCVLVISAGKIKISELPPFAETKIVTNQGKAVKVKWDEGGSF